MTRASTLPLCGAPALGIHACGARASALGSSYWLSGERAHCFPALKTTSQRLCRCSAASRALTCHQCAACLATYAGLSTKGLCLKSKSHCNHDVAYNAGTCAGTSSIWTARSRRETCTIWKMWMLCVISWSLGAPRMVPFRCNTGRWVDLLPQAGGNGLS